MIEQIADGEQGDGEECALYDKASAHLPTCFERVAPPGLQTNDCDAKDGRSNIQVLVFTHLRAVKISLIGLIFDNMTWYSLT